MSSAVVRNSCFISLADSGKSLPGVVREVASRALVLRDRGEEAGHPRGASRCFGRARLSGDREVDVAAEVRAPGEVEVGRRLPRRQVGTLDRVHDHRVVVGGGPVVVSGLLVGGRRDGDDAARVRVVDRFLAEARVVESAERLLDDVDVVVRRVDDRFGEMLDVGDERITDTQRHEHALRADADLAAVVLLGSGILGLARPVAVLRLVARVVVVLEEVPAGDVVDVAVPVVVLPVGEGVIEDEVLGVEHIVRVAVLRARVLPVVVDVEHAICVRVVLRRTLRQRKLAGVHPHLAAKIGEFVGPVDAGVEDGDRHVRTSRARLPRADDARADHAVELLRVVVQQRIAALVARVLQTPGDVLGRDLAGGERRCRMRDIECEQRERSDGGEHRPREAGGISSGQGRS